jgi:hypothetical protein
MKAGLLASADANRLRSGELSPDRAEPDDGVYAVEWQMSQSPSGR